MAAKKENREQLVAEATEKWIEMETSDLLKELEALEEQEERLSQEKALIRALKKALKEVIANRDDDWFEPDYSSEDRLHTMRIDY